MSKDQGSGNYVSLVFRSICSAIHLFLELSPQVKEARVVVSAPKHFQQGSKTMAGIGASLTKIDDGKYIYLERFPGSREHRLGVSTRQDEYGNREKCYRGAGLWEPGHAPG